MKTDKLNPDLVEKIDPELMAGEELLWVGKPQPWRVLWGAETTSGLISIAITLFAMLFISTRFIGSASLSMETLNGESTDVFPIIFGMVLLFMFISLFGGPLWRYIMAHRTTYALTDRRAIIMRGNSVQSYGEKDMEVIERKMGSNDKGDLIFKYNFVRRRRNNHTYTKKIPVGFFGIDHVRTVEALMLEVFGFEDRYQKPKRISRDDSYSEDSYPNEAYYEDDESDWMTR